MACLQLGHTARLGGEPHGISTNKSRGVPSASADPRGLARDLPEEQSGVMALERAGLLIGSQRHGPTHRVGLDKARRQEAEQLVATGETEDRHLRGWIEKG